MRRSIFLLLLMLYNCNWVYGQTEQPQPSTGGCSAMVMLFPADSWVCPGSDSAYFVTAAWNYSHLQWQRSADSGLSWVPAGSMISFQPWLNSNGRDTLRISVSDTAALRYWYRANWMTTGCQPVVTPAVRLKEYLPGQSFWTGYSLDEDWFNPGNWICNHVPDGQTDVRINGWARIRVQGRAVVRCLQMIKEVYLDVTTGSDLHILH